MNRRHALASLLGAGGVLANPAALQAQGQAVLVEVWKSPTCGCCQDWITHLETNGFRAKVNDVGNTAARARLKVPMKLGSCHTAWVGRYAIEGHVPAADIRRLIAGVPRDVVLVLDCAYAEFVEGDYEDGLALAAALPARIARRRVEDQRR